MYYDMSGFDYGILDVVQVLHLRKRRGNYYDCPFCGETHGKLNINVEKNVFRCNRCDASGGMLKLYADLHNVTLSEANQQIREALGKGEYRTDYIKATPVQEEKATAELAPIEEIHRTYQRMLSMLTLNRKHQEDLQRRGLKPEQIEAQRYRSVPLFGMKKLVKRLAEEGYMVKGVPGFYRDTDGNWTINFKAENSGILIPIVSLDGFIQGFQIRVDHVTDTKKYIWLSSVNYDQGVSSGSPVHVIGDLAAERVYLTEGALKGTIAHYLSGATFVCVAGVNQYRNLKPVLERMKGYGMKQLLEAYDMDKKMKVACNKHDSKCAVCFERSPVICQHKAEKRRIIQNGCNKVYEICRELSLPMNRMVWDMSDLYLSNEMTILSLSVSSHPFPLSCVSTQSELLIRIISGMIYISSDLSVGISTIDDGMKLGIRLLLTILLSGNSDEDLANSSISTTFPFSLVYTPSFNMM